MRCIAVRLAVIIAGGFLLAIASCDEHAVVMPNETSHPQQPGLYADTTSDTTSVVDTLFGHITAGSFNPADEVTIVGDTILKDTVVIGYLVPEPDSASSDIMATNDNPYGVPPGECWVEIDIEWYPGSGLIKSITITIVYCVPLEEDGGQGGGSQTDTTSVTLVCSDEDPTFGTTVTCSLDIEPQVGTISGMEWSFTSTDQTQSGGLSWGGPALISGTMRVEVVVNGNDYVREETITVTDRSWRWEPDTQWKFPPCAAGQPWPYTAPWAVNVNENCRTDFFNPQPESPYEVKASEGPWNGLYFVDNPNIPVIRYAMMSPILTPSGDTESLPQDLRQRCDGMTEANEHTVNLVCNEHDTIRAYIEMRDFLETHENEHFSDIARIMADNDMYAAWDMLVGTQSEVENAAADAFPDLLAIHSAMERAARARDRPARPGWLFWAHDDIKWTYGHHGRKSGGS